MTVVVLFKSVFFGEESEEGDGFVENVIDFGFGFLSNERKQSAREWQLAGKTGAYAFETFTKILIDEK